MSKSGYEIWCESCGCLMKLRRGKFGNFYSCTGYPTCRNTMSEKDAAYVQEPQAENSDPDTANDYSSNSYYDYGDD